MQYEITIGVNLHVRVTHHSQIDDAYAVWGLLKAAPVMGIEAPRLSRPLRASGLENSRVRVLHQDQIGNYFVAGDALHPAARLGPVTSEELHALICATHDASKQHPLLIQARNQDGSIYLLPHEAEKLLRQLEQEAASAAHEKETLLGTLQTLVEALDEEHPDTDLRQYINTQVRHLVSVLKKG
jgi:hypothetical protein